MKLPNPEVRSSKLVPTPAGIELRHDVVVAVEHHEGDVAADDQEGHELDDRLDRNRHHQAILMLRRIRMARPECNGEDRQHQRDNQREIAEEREPGRRNSGGCGQENVERGRHCFQLKRDIRDRSDERDQADDSGHPFALAVSRGDEIGDGRDVLRLRHPNDPCDEHVSQSDHQDRAYIDGEKIEAGAAGEPYRPVERPRSAINRERQRGYRGARRTLDDAATRVVAPICDREKQAQIDKRRKKNRPAGDHPVFLNQIQTSEYRFEGVNATGPRSRGSSPYRSRSQRGSGANRAARKSITTRTFAGACRPEGNTA